MSQLIIGQHTVGQRTRAPSAIMPLAQSRSRRCFLGGVVAVLGGVASSPHVVFGADSSPALSSEELRKQRPGLPSIGGVANSTVLIEFLDYRCPYCRSMAPVIARIIQEDASLAFAVEQWPIYGGISIYAAQLALVAAANGLFPQVHNALLSQPLTDEASIRHVVQDAGLSQEAVASGPANYKAAIDDQIRQSARDATILQLTGTPSFLIGKTVIRGALSYDDLKDTITKDR
jgi:protein-disulfide isomerase